MKLMKVISQQQMHCTGIVYVYQVIYASANSSLKLFIKFTRMNFSQYPSYLQESVKFMQLHFSRYSCEHSEKWMHAKKNLIYGMQV